MKSVLYSNFFFRLSVRAAAAFCIAGILRLTVVLFAKVQGTSMRPTLQSGDVLLVSVWRARLRRIRRGDVVICRYPGRGRQHFVKRVRGIPGDTVQRTGGITAVNGVPLDAETPSRLPDYPPYTLYRDEYFCVGDNLRISHDSRSWRRKGSRIVGPIRAGMISGTAVAVVWPPKRIQRLRREDFQNSKKGVEYRP